MCWVNCAMILLSWNLRGLRGRVFHFVYPIFLYYYIFYSLLLQFKTNKISPFHLKARSGMIQTFVVPSLHGIIQMLATSAFNREPMQVGHLFEANPLTPKSDELLILPYNITLESNIKVTRIHDQGNDHLLKKLLIIKKFSLSAPQELYREQYGECAY